MPVRWISDAARELSIDVWDAIALLAREDEYPMNGLLDEDRFQLLRRVAKKGVEASGARSVPPAVRVEPPPVPPRVAAESTSVTTPIPVMPEGSERPTVVYPPRA